MSNTNENNEYIACTNTWYSYFINIQTGEKKLHLDEGDIIVDVQEDLLR